MLQINGKTFMNLQEAVQWLLDNNALPFQSSANYIANTEIGMGTIVNPSPAKVRIGSLIFFADSKVSTVTGLTENGFIVSDQYNDLVDDVVYVSNVVIDPSDYLIVTLSNGTQINAGLIKQVSNFTIDASQHLIVNYNDGTSTDLGAIFSGNVNISGNLTADSIIENMTGYSYADATTGYLFENQYANIIKNGNKLTLVLAGDLTKPTGESSTNFVAGNFEIPLSIWNQLVPTQVGSLTNVLSVQRVNIFFNPTTFAEIGALVLKSGGQKLTIQVVGTGAMTLDVKYYMRVEVTFLLGANLA